MKVGTKLLSEEAAWLAGTPHCGAIKRRQVFCPGPGRLDAGKQVSERRGGTWRGAVRWPFLKVISPRFRVPR
jgi:hypothetical protein